jgi:hypothetical protein
MKKILCTAIALAFMSAPVYAGPVKMTTAQLDEVTAAGNAYGKYKNPKIVIVNNETKVDVDQTATATSTVGDVKNVKIIQVKSDGSTATINIGTATATNTSTVTVAK